MTLEIQEGNKYYKYKNINWTRIHNGELTINYIDENGEQAEEFGPVPEYMRTMDCE